ncbi:unnamed protein product [Scytosiphon promiscuus]
MGLRLQQQGQLPVAAQDAVIQALEAVDTSPAAGSKRGGEKAWIRERLLAMKRSTAEEARQARQVEKRQEGRQAAPSWEADEADTTTPSTNTRQGGDDPVNLLGVLQLCQPPV